ncbi:GNAT family N-acetyltransferase [Anaerofilum sp. BX8]|uniref:GNAT family N-acetyltransferase n=1 Tax=Anaerofilum hominis TaxID=2763016 RepID=A0A923I712_9FIRM|nr:GNAT family N-acetyltransferase [Anaerofilum hominis]MBC5580999.1 GNAT family N-acetyltransferase [Anaerofilum hominis]
MQLTREELGRAGPCFAGWEETMIWSCLDGSMGRVFVDERQAPRAAAASIADFCFLAGRPDAALLREAAADAPLLVPRGEAWAALIEREWGAGVQRFERYATHKDPQAFDRTLLRELAEKIPAGCRVVPIGEALYHRLAAEDWSRDLCSQFPSWADYRRRGLGFAALCGGRPVSGASSYTVWQGGLEIEVDTAPGSRRRGLARACAARLILACLDSGKYPSWDAHNAGSLALAESLGYRSAGPYPAYERTR